jgi:arylsulfatase
LGIKPTPDVITGYQWELYNIKEDFSQSENLATKMPDKLKELQDLFYTEAAKHNVFPLDNSTLERFLTPRPSPTAGRTTFNYSGELSGVPPACAPSIIGRSFTIEAEVRIPERGAEGMIVTQGGRFGGYGLFLSKGFADIRRGKVVFLYNLMGLKRTAWSGPELRPGKHTIAFEFNYVGPGFGKGGTGTLRVDGKMVDTKTLENTEPVMFPEDETFDVGMDTRSAVSLVEYHYDCPFKFTGELDKLTITLGPSELTAANKE